MKKFFLLWILTLLVVVALPVSGQETLTDATHTALVSDGEPVDGVASTAGDSCSGGNSHFDGTMENGFRQTTVGSTFVEHFTAPATNEWAITRVCICFTSLGGTPLANYQVVVFDDDGAGGQPGTELYSFTDTAIDIAAFTSAEWYATSVNFLIPAGETFYIGARWNGSQNAFICVDENGASVQTGYYSEDSGASWGLIPSFASYVDYRALGVAFILGEPIEEEEVPAVNYPNHGEILISAGAPVVPYAAPGEYAQAFTLPADYDGNGFDTYVITGTATVGGATWYSIWVGGVDYLWVPASQVQILR